MANKILHCIYHLRGGGAERQLQLLANASTSFGMEAGVFCVRDEGREAFASSVTLFVSRRTHKFNVGLFAELQRTIQLFQPDILHVWLPEAITIPALCIGALCRLPIVFSYRWSMHWHRPLTVVEFILAAAFSKRVISNHLLARDSKPYHWLFRRKGGVVIPNGVPSVAKREYATPARNSSSVVQILFAGRLTRQKNWQCLLDALPLLRMKHPWRLVMCGIGEDRAEIEARANQLAIADRIELKGFTSDLHAVMRQSDVLVLPSWNEGMSNVFFEALAAQLPCIVSNIPQHREMVITHGCARLFNPHSPEDLAQVIEEILLSVELQQQLRKAGVSAVRHYAVETMVERHMTLYRAMLEPPPCKGKTDNSRQSADLPIVIRD